MRAVSTYLAEAIAARQRSISMNVFVDWDGDGFGSVGSIDDVTPWVSAVSIDQALSGSLPEQIRLVEGSAAASTTITLAGGDGKDDRRSAAWLFSRLNTASPLYGKERLSRRLLIQVAFRTDVGVETLDLFNGRTRGAPVVSGGTVTITGLDRREDLRDRVSLPVIAANVPDTGTGVIIKPGLEGTWVVSYVLAKQGIYASPPPRAACRYWAPMHGSTYPFIGGDLVNPPAWADTVTASQAYMTTAGVPGPCDFGPGPYVLGTRPLLGRNLTTSTPMAPGQVMANGQTARGRVEMWCRFDAFNASTGTQTGVEVKVSAINPETGATHYVRAGLVKLAGGGAQMVLIGPSGTIATGPTITPSAGTWQFVGWTWDGTSAAFNANGFTSTTAITAQVWPTTEADPRVDITTPGANPLVGIAEVQVTPGLDTIAAWQYTLAASFVPGAIIDRSELRLDGMLAASAAEKWALLQDLAAAEQAAAYYDGPGVFHFAGPARLAGTEGQTVQTTLSADTSLLELGYADAVDQIVNSCRGTATNIRLRLAEQIYSHDEKVQISGGGLRTLTVPLAGPAVQIRSITVQARAFVDGTGTDYTSAMKVGIRLLDPVTAEITIKNTSSASAWLVNGSGNSTIIVTGDWLETASTATAMSPETDTDSIASFGEQPLDLPSSAWRQRDDDARALARRVVDDMATPRPFLDQISIVGDPRLELGDRVRIQDPQGLALDGEYWLSGIRHNWDDSGAYTQSITARRARRVARWDIDNWSDTDTGWGV